MFVFCRLPIEPQHVGQTFLSAGSGDFSAFAARRRPVARRNTGLESPVNQQAGKPALLPNSTSQCALQLPLPLEPDETAQNPPQRQGHRIFPMFFGSFITPALTPFLNNPATCETMAGHDIFRDGLCDLKCRC
jgi:hypothetical protein